jgi:hypothetical protein
MHDAQLHAGLRIGRANRFGEPRQPVDAGHENIAQPAVLQVGQTSEPKFGSFVLAEPQPEQFLVPFEIHAQRDVNRVLRDASVRAADMHDDAGEIDDRPNRFQWPRAPSGHLRVEVGGDFRNQRGGNVHAVQLAHDVLDVAGGHALGVQGEDFFVEAGHAPLVLADHLRLERAVTIARRGDG